MPVWKGSWFKTMLLKDFNMVHLIYFPLYWFVHSNSVSTVVKGAQKQIASLSYYFFLTLRKKDL